MRRFKNECMKRVLQPLNLVMKGDHPAGVRLRKQGSDGVMREHTVYVDAEALSCDLGDLDQYLCYYGYKALRGDPRTLVSRELWGLGEGERAGARVGIAYADAPKRSVDELRRLVEDYNSVNLEDKRAAAEELASMCVEPFVPAIFDVPHSPGYSIYANDALHQINLGINRTALFQAQLHFKSRYINQAEAGRRLTYLGDSVDLLALYFPLAPKGLGLDDTGTIRATSRFYRDMLTAIAFRGTIVVTARQSATGQAFELDLREYGTMMARLFDWSWLLFRPVQSEASLKALSEAARVALSTATKLLGTDAMGTLKVWLMQAWVEDWIELGHPDGYNTAIGEGLHAQLKACSLDINMNPSTMAVAMAAESELHRLMDQAETLRGLSGEDGFPQAGRGLLQRCSSSESKIALSPPLDAAAGGPRPIDCMAGSADITRLCSERPEDAQALRSLPMALAALTKGAAGSVRIFAAAAVVAQHGREEGDAVAIRAGRTVAIGGQPLFPIAGSVQLEPLRVPASYGLVHAIVVFAPAQAGACGGVRQLALVRRFAHVRDAESGLQLKDEGTNLQRLVWAGASTGPMEAEEMEAEEVEAEEVGGAEGARAAAPPLPQPQPPPPPEMYDCVPLELITGYAHVVPDPLDPAFVRHVKERMANKGEAHAAGGERRPPLADYRSFLVIPWVQRRRPA